MPGAGADAEDENRRSAHDLLQSVAILQALLGTLRASDMVKPEGRDTVDLMGREIAMIAALCQRQLSDSPHLSSVDLAAVATDVVERARLTYGGEITLDLSSATVDGDPLEWHRCLFNLVENACRAASEAGKVAVRLWTTEGTLRLAVGDSGPGFGEAMAGRASLGMITVTRVVESHSGHLELRESPLGGAELTIVVPAPQLA
jgi:signal transduction histidine kinase